MRNPITPFGVWLFSIVVLGILTVAWTLFALYLAGRGPV